MICLAILLMTSCSALPSLNSGGCERPPAKPQLPPANPDTGEVALSREDTKNLLLYFHSVDSCFGSTLL